MTENEHNKMLDFAQLTRLIIKDLNSTNNQTNSLSKFSAEQVARYLQNPLMYGKELRNLSNYLYSASPNYKRLILYFACLLTFDYVIEPMNLNFDKVDKDKFKKQYLKVANNIEVMNLQHEMVKVLRTAFKEDIFFGYEHQTKESYFIQKMNPDYCQISSIEDGVYNYAFNFSFFDQPANKDKLKTYPDEFKQKYNIYKNTKEKWQELSSENTICIKINEEIEYPIPPFNVVFESIFDIDEYKKLKKAKTQMDNYMILTQHIPLDEKSGEANQFLIDLDTAIQFHNKASESLPDSVGLVTSPMKIEGIKLDRRQIDKDSVAEAERDYFNSAGVSQLLFNSDKATSVGLSKSVQTDEQILFAVLRQIERWVNRKVKNFSSQYSFKVRFLNTTVFNVDEVFEKYLKAAQYGMPVKNALAASVGITPSSMSSMAFLENEVLGLHDMLIPLSSSHTQSGKEEAGRKAKSEDELSESGQKTRDNDSNVKD